MKDLEQPYTEKKTKIIYNPIAWDGKADSVEILRIVQEEDLTRIDFAHRASGIYLDGGWVSIQPGTFIRPVSTDIKLTMIQAVNIPVAPCKHWYKSAKQFLYYTLYFPALPTDVEAIDIIEREAARPNNYFNFHCVSLEKIAREVLIVPN
jgi:hypothetical protein